MFDSVSLERGVKTGGVSNVSNGLGNSKGIIGKARCSLARRAGKAASSASGLSPQAGGVVRIHS